MRVVLRIAGAPSWAQGIRHLGLAASPVDGVESRPEQFRRLANAALATGYYSHPDRANRLLSAADTATLPVITARELLDRPGAFVNAKSSHSQPRFVCPIETELPLVAGVELTLPAHGRYLAEAQWRKLHMHPATLLAATPALLRRLCAGVEARLMVMPRLTDAVVCLNSLRAGSLYAGERDLLWRALGVPIYEQWLGLDGELLAWECEAHEGLHFNPQYLEVEFGGEGLTVTSFRARRHPVPRLATGWSAELDERPCCCGSILPRLMGLTSGRVGRESEVEVTAGAALAASVA
jgi:hypothetical protein